ncbi:MAG TPA: hypothetical protein VFY89_00190, partial [Ktedonobacterales bacterium]
GGTDDAFEQTVRRINAQAPKADADGLIALASVFGSRFIGVERVQEIVRKVRMSTEILDEFPLFQQMKQRALEEGRAEGEAIGRAEGEAKGKAEGEAKGMREIMLMVLRGRFGELPPELEQAIMSADLARIVALGPHAATYSLDELAAHLTS